MALQRTNLGFPQFLPSSVGSIYSNPSGKKTYLKGIILHNTNTVSEEIAIHFVQNSGGAVGTAALGNRIGLPTLASKETLFFPLGVDGHPFILPSTNDSLQVSTTTASKVTATIIGDIENA